MANPDFKPNDLGAPFRDGDGLVADPDQLRPNYQGILDSIENLNALSLKENDIRLGRRQPDPDGELKIKPQVPRKQLLISRQKQG